jgi:hypothetical protein
MRKPGAWSTTRDESFLRSSLQMWSGWGSTVYDFFRITQEP